MPSEVEKHKRIQEELCTIPIHRPVFCPQLPTHLSMCSLNSAHTIWLSDLSPQSLLLPSACLMTIPPSSAQAKHPAVILASSFPFMASNPLLNAGPCHHHLPSHQLTATSDLPASSNSDKTMTQCVLVFLDLYSAPHSLYTSHSGFYPRPWTCQTCSCLRAFAPQSPPSETLSSLYTHGPLQLQAFFRSAFRCQPQCWGIFGTPHVKLPLFLIWHSPARAPLQFIHTAHHFLTLSVILSSPVHHHF